MKEDLGIINKIKINNLIINVELLKHTIHKHIHA